MSGTILLVEDEGDLVAPLAYALEREGYKVLSSGTGRGGLELADKGCDLVVLDLMLPDLSGVEVCRQLRQNPKTQALPIIMVTAKGAEIDRVVGFEVGADDYVVKPYSVRELVLRIRALLRRNTSSDDAATSYSFGPIRVDVDAHTVSVGGEDVRLTALEFRLLTTFIERKGRLQTRETLLSDVWGIDADVTTRTVDTHVKRLREKLGEAGIFVETVRGVGYRFRSRPDAEA